MTEATGYEAQTIHRLLELNGVPDDDNRESQGIHFDRNAENPLDTDVIIIDEMSMVDIFLDAFPASCCDSRNQDHTGRR